jgi:hypothetical protein
MHTQSYAVGATTILLGLLLSGCGIGQPAGYAEGVRDAETMLLFGEDDMIAEMDSQLAYSGFCQGTWLYLNSDVPIEHQQGYMQGCMDAVRAASESLR